VGRAAATAMPRCAASCLPLSRLLLLLLLLLQPSCRWLLPAWQRLHAATTTLPPARLCPHVVAAAQQHTTHESICLLCLTPQLQPPNIPPQAAPRGPVTPEGSSDIHAH